MELCKHKDTKKASELRDPSFSLSHEQHFSMPRHGLALAPSSDKTSPTSSNILCQIRYWICEYKKLQRGLESNAEGSAKEQQNELEHNAPCMITSLASSMQNRFGKFLCLADSFYCITDGKINEPQAMLLSAHLSCSFLLHNAFFIPGRVAYGACGGYSVRLN